MNRGSFIINTTAVVLMSGFWSWCYFASGGRQVESAPISTRNIKQQRPVPHGVAFADGPRPRVGGSKVADPTSPVPVAGVVKAIPPEVPDVHIFNSVQWAVDDVRRLPSTIDPYYVRWVSAHNVRPAKRQIAWHLTSFAINSISSESQPKIPPVLANTRESLIRIDLRDYGIDPKQWDRLASLGSGRVPEPEPYYQQPTVKITPAVIDPYRPTFREVQKEDPPGVKWFKSDGSPVMVRVPGLPVGPTSAPTADNKKKFTPFASWTTFDRGKAMEELIQRTGTQYPILRADWFITYALWAPRYYDLLGLGGNANLRDFQAKVKVRAAADSDVTLAGAVVKPPKELRVTLNNRVVLFVPATSFHGAYYWQTNDSRKSTDERQYMNTFLDFLKTLRGIHPSIKKVKFADATEDIGCLLNGLQAYFLSDGDGNRLDVAAIDIARDRESRYSDVQVWSARNCITCHTRGLRPMQDAVRTFSKDLVGLFVTDDDPNRTNTRLVESFFGKDVDPIITANQLTYDSSIRAVTRGWSSERLSREFMDLTAGYLDDGIGLAEAAWEVGVPQDDLGGLLKRAVGIDPTLTGLIKDPVVPIRRDQWEVTSYPQLMQYLDAYFRRNVK